MSRKDAQVYGWAGMRRNILKTKVFKAKPCDHF